MLVVHVAFFLKIFLIQQFYAKITTQPQATYFTAHYFIFNRLAVGLALGLNTVKGTYDAAIGPGSVAGTYTTNYKTVAMELYYIYLFRKNMELYTFAGAGPSQLKEQSTLISPYGSSTQTYGAGVFKGQITPVGIRFGGRLGGYAELGYGYKGLLNLGISFKLGPSSWWSDDL